MKTFALLSTLATLAAADPQLLAGHLGHPLAYGLGYKTVTPYANPGVHAVVGAGHHGAPVVGIKAGLPYGAHAAHATHGVHAAHVGHAAPVAHAAHGVHAAPVAHAAHGVHAAHVGHAAPVAHAAHAVAHAAAVPAAPLPKTVAAVTPAHAAVPGAVASQYHSQDEAGNYEYGYANPNSAKQERGNKYSGAVEGSYSYVDSYGLNQKVNYVADHLGFRASGTNFPATAATLGLNRYRRSIAAPVAPVAYAGLVPQGAYAPAAYAGLLPQGAYGPAAEVISAPAAREAVLTRVQLNPGHAVAYRVD